jgi:hypothetical protein
MAELRRSLKTLSLASLLTGRPKCDHRIGIARGNDRLSCLSWKWRKRSSVKINGRTYEERA